jgi:hypothetical protein
VPMDDPGGTPVTPCHSTAYQITNPLRPAGCPRRWT